MSRRIVYLGGLGVLCVLGASAWAIFGWAGFAQDPAPDDVVHHRDVAYARVGGEDLHLDVAMPNKPGGPFPAVVCLHGGGWVSGSRKQMARTIEALARCGYVGVAVDYRLAPKHRWPACIEDCKEALRWLSTHDGTYRIDADRIGVMGLSAGGHLACLLGTGEHRMMMVRAVVSVAGPTDLTAEETWTKDVREKNLEPLFGGPPETRRALLREASPLHGAILKPPRFLFLHGAADPVVPVRHVQALADRLRQAGGGPEVVVWEGEGHTWAGPNLSQSLEKMLTFFDENLKM